MNAVEITWLACDLRTGRIAEELPALRATGPLSRRIGSVTNTSLSLDLVGAPLEWEAATDPARTLLVAVDTATAVPLWSGIPLPRVGGSANAVTFTAASSECYLDRRYAAYSGTGVDRSTVMAGVAAPLLTDGPPFVIDDLPTGSTMDYTVTDEDDKTILSVLQELDGQDGAPEWTIDTVWADTAQTSVELILRIHPAIGIQPDIPATVFDMPGCVADYTLTESYERGRGATQVIARGDTQGGGRTSSAVHTADDLLAAGWCLWEYRYNPGAGVTDTGQLDAHAAQSLALMRTGSRAWTLQAAASAAPRLGTDWGLGDTITLAVAPDTSPRHPAGVLVTARAWGWDLDAGADKLTPILLED
ncbi:hypothetical protein AB0953_16425 [Streptomyces sp. NPDC046866]|uniref:hypothetical protein n=1 Tax=Streptomyces sp. NPDC046866 TaxID=3154921 RepID=UPI003453051B